MSCSCIGEQSVTRPPNPGLRRFLRDDRGAALVEFALSLPLILVVFATVIEGGRMMWSYQTAAAGVRDAARYLARVVPSDICTTGGSVAGHTSRLTDIVRQSINGDTLLPGGISIETVTPALRCVAGDYRVSPVPIVTVTATLTVTFPFAGIFDLAGDELNSLTAIIADENRVYGS